MTQDGDPDDTRVLISVPPSVARRWDDLMRRAKVQGGAPDDDSAVELICAWAATEAARRSRDS